MMQTVMNRATVCVIRTLTIRKFVVFVWEIIFGFHCSCFGKPIAADSIKLRELFLKIVPWQTDELSIVFTMKLMQFCIAFQGIDLLDNVFLPIKSPKTCIE